MNMQDGPSSSPPGVMVVVAGPTAVGKTSFSVELAKVFDTEIISADSRQFYREMSIGTAKPSQEEMQGIRHHFVGFLSIADTYNVSDFETDVIRFLNGWFKNHRVAIMTGGSGLYVKAVCEGIDEMPDIPSEIRNRLKKELDEKGLAAMADRLKAVDPEYYHIADTQNPARILRGLEVYESSGLPFSSFRTGEKSPRDFRVIKIGLERERKELNDRIERRMDEMIAAGLFEEAGKLFSYRHYNALNTVGYKEIFDHLMGQYDREEAVRLLKRNSRRYAKRQMTWFKKDQEIAWFHPSEFQRVVNFIEEKVRGAML